MLCVVCISEMHHNLYQYRIRRVVGASFHAVGNDRVDRDPRWWWGVGRERRGRLALSGRETGVGEGH